MESKWHSLSYQDVEKKLKTNIDNGLTQEEVEQKRKEFGVNVISIIIDNPETFTMDIDEVAEINSEILDLVNDYIPDGYYLEVTTPGIERELKTEKDFNRAIDKYIYIKTYQKIDDAYGLKEINGYLKEVLENDYVVEVLHMGRRKIVNIPKSAVAKIRLAVKF